MNNNLFKHFFPVEHRINERGCRKEKVGPTKGVPVVTSNQISKGNWSHWYNTIASH